MAGPTRDFLLQRCRIDEETGCWLWALHVTARGMPQGRNGGGAYYAHRAMWEAVKGPVPPGMLVYHLCDHGHCINPKHLACGTRKEQMQAAARMGKTSRGAAHAAACLRSIQPRFSEEQVAEVRRRIAAGETAIDVARDLGMHFSHAYRIAAGKARASREGFSVFNQLHAAAPVRGRSAARPTTTTRPAP